MQVITYGAIIGQTVVEFHQDLAPLLPPDASLCFVKLSLRIII